MKPLLQKAAFRWFLDLFYPNRCGICDCIVNWNAYLCDSCLDQLKQEFSDDPCICETDFNLYSGIDQVFSAGKYRGQNRTGILTLKYRKNINYGVFLGMKLAEQIQTTSQYKPDCIVPVPMSQSKQRKRGYNQACIIAKSIASVLQIPVETDCLIRIESKTEQHTLSASERLVHSQSVFRAGTHLIPGKTVLLCDDVMTTGATASCCAALLRQQGAEHVLLAVGAYTTLEAEKHLEEMADEVEYL